MTDEAYSGRRTYNCNFEPPAGYTPPGDGYDWIEFLNSQPKTVVVGAWGCSGWDLGSWPYVSMALRRNEGDTFTTISYCEGDIEEVDHLDRDAAAAFIDKFAEFYWRCGQADGPSDIDKYPEGELPAKYRGPYSADRHSESDE